MIIKNAMVYTQEGNFKVQDICMSGEFFANVCDEDDVLNAEGCYAIPGLTDIHFHGCVGYDFCDGNVEAIDKIASFQAREGITTIVPATMTVEEDALFRVCRAAADYFEKQELGQYEKNALLCGINMEGPFISREKAGAQNPVFIRKPDAVLFDDLQEASGGLIKLLAIAPEAEGAISFIREKSGKLILSVAHTAAGYDTAMEAFAAGAGHVTHLYNAMSPLSHREPGIVGAAVDTKAEVELICDGVHVHPSMVRTTIQMMGEDKVIFISDSMRATGLADGNYTLGGQAVTVTGNRAALEDGTLAGSVTSLMECLKIAVSEMKIPLETAVKCAAVNPAKCVGIYDRYGSITPGKYANLVLLDKEDLSVRKVFLKGREI